MRSTHKLSLFVLLVLVATAACSSQEQGRVQTAVVGAGQTAAADMRGSAETRVAQARDTALAAVNDQRNRVGTEIAQQIAPSPWDTRWLPPDHSYAAARVDGILAPTGMAGQGTPIVETGVKMGVNPAFALSMFRKEASFAAPKTPARTNNNPGNIIATGDCHGKSAGTPCSGIYGETGTDGRFGVYDSMADGTIAYFALLAREYRPGTDRNCQDMPCIIEAYCPPSECNVELYLELITTWTRQYQLEILAP